MLGGDIFHSWERDNSRAGIKFRKHLLSRADRLSERVDRLHSTNDLSAHFPRCMNQSVPDFKLERLVNEYSGRFTCVWHNALAPLWSLSELTQGSLNALLTQANFSRFVASGECLAVTINGEPL